MDGKGNQPPPAAAAGGAPASYQSGGDGVHPIAAPIGIQAAAANIQAVQYQQVIGGGAPTVVAPGAHVSGSVAPSSTVATLPYSRIILVLKYIFYL